MDLYQILEVAQGHCHVPCSLTFYRATNGRVNVHGVDPHGHNSHVRSAQDKEALFVVEPGQSFEEALHVHCEKVLTEKLEAAIQTAREKGSEQEGLRALITAIRVSRTGNRR